MEVRLLENVRQSTIDVMPNWNRIQSHIPSNIPDPLLPYAQAHDSALSKISFAEYHFNNLNQLYRPDATERTTDTSDWVRAEINSIVMNLYSALDTFFEETNLSYGFHVPESKIHTWHSHTSIQPNCIRCRLNTAGDSLSTRINTELSGSWFDIFHKFRNQMMHQSLPVIMVHIRVSELATASDRTTRFTIPNDPSLSNPGYSDYSMNLEANDYCRRTIDRVRLVIDNSYPLFESRVLSLYGI
jgi:hypothetical protein